MDPEALVFTPSENSMIHYPEDNPCLSPAPQELGIVSPLPEAYVPHQGSPPMSPNCVVSSSASFESDEELSESSKMCIWNALMQWHQSDHMSDMIDKYMKNAKQSGYV